MHKVWNEERYVSQSFSGDESFSTISSTSSYKTITKLHTVMHGFLVTIVKLPLTSTATSGRSLSTLSIVVILPQSFVVHPLIVHNSLSGTNARLVQSQNIISLELKWWVWDVLIHIQVTGSIQCSNDTEGSSVVYVRRPYSPPDLKLGVVGSSCQVFFWHQ